MDPEIEHQEYIKEKFLRNGIFLTDDQAKTISETNLHFLSFGRAGFDDFILVLAREKKFGFIDYGKLAEGKHG